MQSGTNPMEQFPDNRITYYYKGNPYRILLRSFIKFSETWVPVIIYQCLYENEDGMIWVREEKQFYKLFKTFQSDDICTG